MITRGVSIRGVTIRGDHQGSHVDNSFQSVAYPQPATRNPTGTVADLAGAEVWDRLGLDFRMGSV